MAEPIKCPFCGRIPTVEDCGTNRWFVRCQCGIAQDKLYHQRCDAVRAWNRRKSIQPERKKGKWIYGEDKYGIDGYHCDKCGFFVPWNYAHTFINYIDDYNFCPNCGADMRGEQDDDNGTD